jgi:hypothetical protein
MSFPNGFIGNLFERALIARFPLNRFAGMTGELLEMKGVGHNVVEKPRGVKYL